MHEATLWRKAVPSKGRLLHLTIATNMVQLLQKGLLRMKKILQSVKRNYPLAIIVALSAVIALTASLTGSRHDVPHSGLWIVLGLILGPLILLGIVAGAVWFVVKLVVKSKQATRRSVAAAGAPTTPAKPDQ